MTSSQASTPPPPQSLFLNSPPVPFTKYSQKSEHSIDRLDASYDAQHLPPQSHVVPPSGLLATQPQNSRLHHPNKPDTLGTTTVRAPSLMCADESGDRTKLASDWSDRHARATAPANRAPPTLTMQSAPQPLQPRSHRSFHRANPPALTRTAAPTPPPSVSANLRNYRGAKGPHEAANQGSFFLLTVQ